MTQLSLTIEGVPGGAVRHLNKASRHVMTCHGMSGGILVIRY